MIQATDLDNLFDRTLALSLQPPMKGDNLLIITNGGGVGVLATDAAENYGSVKFAPADVQAELKKHMPEFGSAKNPVDLTGMAGNEWYDNSVQLRLCPSLGRWSGRAVLRNRHDRSRGNCPSHQAGRRRIRRDKTNPSPFPLSVANARQMPCAGWLKMAFLPTAPPIWLSTPWPPCANMHSMRRPLAEPAEACEAVDRKAAARRSSPRPAPTAAIP